MPMPHTVEFELPNLRDPNLRKKKGFQTRGPGPGRPKGLENKITKDLKLGIIDAAAAHGADGYGAGGLTGYLLHLATNHPKAFCSLLGKMLPYQINSTMQSASVSQVRIISVPADQYLSKEDARKLATLDAPAIEHEAPEAQAIPPQDVPPGLD